MDEPRLTPEQIDALAEFLRQIPLFEKLEPEELRAFASIANFEDYQSGEELYRQSDADNTLYLIYSGEIALAHIDPQGAPNEVGTRVRGDVLGESSLLLGEPHDVTAKAVGQASAFVFERNAFKELCAHLPGLQGRLRPKEENYRKIHAPHYGWQGDDEAVVLFTREHSWALIRVLILPIGVSIAAVLLVIALAPSVPVLAIGISVVATLILAGVIGYLVIDWRNDFYVVTNKRLVHVDEIALIRKKRQEAPLSAVTEIQFARNSVIAHMLDFGDLRVETFSGAVGMKDIPHPNDVKNSIQREIERVKARARASERNAIRDELTKRIIAREPAVETTPAVKVTALPRPSPFAIAKGIFRYFFPLLREEQGDAIIWRKHWVVLWQTAKWPSVLLLITFWALINWWNRWPPFGTDLSDDVWWIWPLLLLSFGAWWLWVFEDWRNDQYIITANRIIDIEKTPFFLNERRRESTLSRIQTTEIKVPSPMARALRYGDLIIRVPGAEIKFLFIQDPAGVQSEVNKRLAEFNRRQAENEARGRRTELSDWFAAYEQLRQQQVQQQQQRVSTAAPSPQVVGGEQSHDRS